MASDYLFGIFKLFLYTKGTYYCYHEAKTDR
jgi:hypothetical protein